jgi:hypothetical protein
MNKIFLWNYVTIRSGVKSNTFVSNKPILLSFSEGMTSKAINDKVINGADNVLPKSCLAH